MFSVPKYLFLKASKGSTLAQQWPEAVGAYELKQEHNRHYPYYRKCDGNIRREPDERGTIHKVVQGVSEKTTDFPHKKVGQFVSRNYSSVEAHTLAAKRPHEYFVAKV